MMSEGYKLWEMFTKNYNGVVTPWDALAKEEQNAWEWTARQLHAQGWIPI